VNGYYVGYNADRLVPEDIYWDGLTHISVGAILAIDASATDSIPPAFDKSFYRGGEAQGAAFARSVTALARQHGVIPVLMLGGMGNGADIRNAAGPDSLAGFADGLIATARGLGFQGIDLDWEDDIDWERFRNLVAELRGKAPDFVLNLPVGNLNPNYADPSVEEIAKLAPYLDQINAMSYFGCGTVWYGEGWHSGFGSALMADSGPGGNPVSIEHTLATYAAAGIEKKKLGLGIGFYGFGYADGITGPRQDGDRGSGGVIEGVFRGGDNEYMLSTLFTGEAYLYAAANGCVRWDDAVKCSYLSLPAGHPDSFGCRYVSFEDERSLMEKGAFCREQGYGGAIVWTIDQGYVKDHADPHFLMKALRKGFLEPGYAISPSMAVFPKRAYAKPGRSAQFRALATGSADRAFAWSAGGGSIDANGLFTAGAGQGTFTVTASANGLSAGATATVSNASWKPNLAMYYRDAFWKELRADDASVSAVKMLYGGMTFHWTREQYDPRVFTNADEVPEGGSIVLVAETEDGRRASSAPFAYHCNHADPDWEEMAIPLSDE
jgi:chitinase